jgi:hypothetical protein
MQRTLKPGCRANLSRRPPSRIRLEILEERLPPGDALFGALLGSWWLGTHSLLHREPITSVNSTQRWGYAVVEPKETIRWETGARLAANGPSNSAESAAKPILPRLVTPAAASLTDMPAWSSAIPATQAKGHASAVSGALATTIAAPTPSGLTSTATVGFSGQQAYSAPLPQRGGGLPGYTTPPSLSNGSTATSASSPNHAVPNTAITPQASAATKQADPNGPRPHPRSRRL